MYGAKKWILYPPHSMIMSNRQILDYFETDKMAFSERGVQGQSCVQLAGDFIFSIDNTLLSYFCSLYVYNIVSNSLSLYLSLSVFLSLYLSVYLSLPLSLFRISNVDPLISVSNFSLRRRNDCSGELGPRSTELAGDCGCGNRGQSVTLEGSPSICCHRQAP